MPDRVIMVRESEWREMREALEWYASEGEENAHYIVDANGGRLARFAEFASRARTALAKPEGADDGLLRGRIAYALTKRLVIDMPTARAAVDEAFRNLARDALSHPTPDGCGREGNHRWTGPGIGSDRIRCIDCGATKAWKEGDDG